MVVRRTAKMVRSHVRLEKAGALDNMLTNKIGARTSPRHDKGERLPMKKMLLALLLAASVTPALAQEKTFELKLSHWVPASHPLQKALEDWGSAVEKESGGTIKYKVFPAQQLGKAFDHYDMARDGIADVTYVNPGYQPGRFPIIGAGELPFLMSDAKGGSMALDVWYRKYAEKEMKDVKFCLAFIHSPSSVHSRATKITVPDDIENMKIRPAHATMANFVTLLGGTNVQSSAPEVRDSIERVVADGVRKAGTDPDAAMAELRSALAKYNALTQ